MASRSAGVRALARLSRAGPALCASLPCPAAAAAALQTNASAGSSLLSPYSRADAPHGPWRGYACGVLSGQGRPQVGASCLQALRRAVALPAAGLMATGPGGSAMVLGEGAGVAMATRGMATRMAAQKAKHNLRFRGGKSKPYTSLKERFKVLKSTGEVKRWRKGYRHRRSRKSKEQKYRLRKPATVYKAYASVMKRLGMKGF